MRNVKLDLYATLGVARDASQDEIKRAFRKLTLTHHPDRNPGDTEAESRFKDISQAYEILGDADKRKRYDALAPVLDISGFTVTHAGVEQVDIDNLLQTLLQNAMQQTDFLGSYTEKLERIKNLTIPEDVAKQRDEQVAEAKKQGDVWIAEAEKKAKAVLVILDSKNTTQEAEADDWVVTHIANARRRVEQGQARPESIQIAEFEAHQRREDVRRMSHSRQVEYRKEARKIRKDAVQRAREHVNTQRRLAKERAYEEAQLRLTAKEQAELDRRIQTVLRQQKSWRNSRAETRRMVLDFRNRHIWKIGVAFAVSVTLLPMIPYVGGFLSAMAIGVGVYVLLPGVFMGMLNLAWVGIRGLKRRKSLSDASDPQAD